MLVNQNVNAANFLQIGNQANAASQNAKTETAKGEQSFESFLKPAARNQEKSEPVKTENNVKNDTKTDKISDSNNTVKDEGNSKKPDNDSAVKEAKDVKDQTVSNTDSNKDDQMVVDDEPLTTEETEALFEIIGQLLQTVMNELQISPDELEVKIEDYGMEPEDLLTSDGIREFFLNMKEAEPSDLLVNEDLNLQLNDLVKEVEQLVESIDIPMEVVEQFVEENNIQEIVKHDTEKVVSNLEENVTFTTSEKVEIDEQYTDEPLITEEPKVIVDDNRDTNNRQENQQTFDGQKEMSAGREVRQSVHEQRNSAKETKTPFENPFLQAVGEAIDNITDVSPIAEAQVNSRQIVEQIVEQVRVQMNNTSTSLEMQLYPEHLGKIQIQVVSKDGVMTARIAAETEAAKQAIEGGLTNLRESMEQQNIKVEAIEVMVSTTGFGQNPEEQNMEQQQRSSKSNRNMNLTGLDEEEIDEDSAEEEKMRAVGSSVSYTA